MSYLLQCVSITILWTGKSRYKLPTTQKLVKKLTRVEESLFRLRWPITTSHRPAILVHLFILRLNSSFFDSPTFPPTSQADSKDDEHTGKNAPSYDLPFQRWVPRQSRQLRFRDLAFSFIFYKNYKYNQMRA